MNKANESKEDPSCFPIFCLGCLSYCTSIATFHGTRALMPEDVTFPLTLSIITGIGTWNIGKQCCKLGQDYMKKQRPKEKIR